MESLRWYIIAAVSLVAAAIFSGSEIGIYSISKIRLRLRVAKRDPNALQLADWLERPTYALEGLLVWANFTTFMFEDSVSHLLGIYHFSPVAASLINIAIVTPTVLIFADIMPKDLFHTHADSWMYRLVPTMKWLFGVIKYLGILPLVNLFSRTSMWLIGANRKRGGSEPPVIGPRAEILTLFQESAATGVLTGTQQDLVQRALRLARISVREVMIPWNRVVGVPVSISKDGFRALVRRYNVSRMPVLGRSTTEVLGIVDVIDVLTPRGATTPQGAGGLQPAPAEFKLSAHLHPAMTLIGEQNVRSAITLMQRARQTTAVVVDRQNRAIGIVTMKDLIEELVGDLENW